MGIICQGLTLTLYKQWRILNNDLADVVAGVDQDGEQGPGNAAQDQEGERGDKEEEVLVVAPSDTVVHPGAVVIEVLACVCVRVCVCVCV